MIWQITKVLIAAILISLCSGISQKKPVLAGFLLSLPLVSMIALALSHIQSQNTDQSIQFAKSIFVAVPLSLLFFVPFLFAKQINLNFWYLYLIGFALLGLAYGIHSAFMK